LEEEREFARKNRDKFKGFSNQEVGGGISSNSYKGFGSEDIRRGGEDAHIGGGSYDTSKKDSIFGGNEDAKPKKKSKKKRRKETSSESESEDSSEEDSDESEDEQPTKISRKGKKSQGLKQPRKKGV